MQNLNLMLGLPEGEGLGVWESLLRLALVEVPEGLTEVAGGGLPQGFAPRGSRAARADGELDSGCS